MRQLVITLATVLATGGQARVYEVSTIDADPPTTFAAKVLSNSGNQQARARFLREIEAVKSIDHPVVVKIVDHWKEGEDPDFLYYIMELLESAVSLKGLLGKSENPYHANPISAINAIIEMLKGLQACERQGITHRDLSPNNVLMLPTGQIRLIDFGCCHVDLPEGGVTLTDENVGTPNYRAPECEAHSEIGIDSRADLYSVGKLLWCMVTNKAAFPREKIWEVENLQLRFMFHDDPSLWHLVSMFQGTIQESPEDRFSNVSDALAEARQVRRLIDHRYLPVEAMNMGWCPVCGTRNMKPYKKACPDGRWFEAPVFKPAGKHLAEDDRFVCTHCGYTMLIHQDMRDQTIRERLVLQIDDSVKNWTPQEVFELVKGDWHLEFKQSRTEDLTIDGAGNYFTKIVKRGQEIATNTKPKFRLSVLEYDRLASRVKWEKQPQDGGKRQVEVLTVSSEVMEGQAEHDGHRLLYRRR
ncbi:MAG: serine/threonine protein kinase [Planctomycetes bacterium]|nr:serine/threonine protein kinase [Planctomycetota bacterium]